MNRDAMKTSTVGVLGTATTLTLKEFNDVVAAIAGVLTVAYMLTKWIVLIRDMRKQKTKGKR